jgi:Helicase conserved C-terminal domain
MSTQSNRDALIERLRRDLIGPEAQDEVVRARPSDVYLTGILYPRKTAFSPEENEKLSVEGGTEQGGSEAEQSPIDRSTRPSAAGISFAVRCPEASPSVTFRIYCGTYSALYSEERLQPEANSERSRQSGVGKSVATGWQRTNHLVEIPNVSLKALEPIDLGGYGLPQAELYIQVTDWQDKKLVTAVLINCRQAERGDSRDELEQKMLFQTKVTVIPSESTTLVARPARAAVTDEDSRAADLLYRNAVEFATGHTCSSEWESEEGSLTANLVATTWIPQAVVPVMSSAGHRMFEVLLGNSTTKPLSAEWLASSDRDAIGQSLDLLTGAYLRWIQAQEAAASNLSPEHQQQAARHMAECRRVHGRLSEAVRLVRTDAAVATAFRLANKAMAVQRCWTYPGQADLTWRPFQLAFILLNLPSLAEMNHSDRRIMDLLWFPTGGGKTEAYLGLIAFVLFHRRLRHAQSPDRGAGVAAIMRYTLRLLTTQQFQRAAAMVLACEQIRRKVITLPGVAANLGEKEFSIGLWVGGDSVPNDTLTACQALQANDPARPTPAQLSQCPACSRPLRWYCIPDRSSVRVKCTNRHCVLANAGRDLPVWTVDDDVYREMPSLVIGTIDKFAQIVRNPSTHVLFGIRQNTDAPDLILQDELHLISGPLGTLTALYETAIDRLCTRGTVKPKIIGSTATIRRAEQQIRALFDRSTCQFPPPGIDAVNSGFAVEDPHASGRFYLGVTTAGRSAKFTIQAVCASLLQSAASNLGTEAERDPYWTLVAYFNSLRELGGALVLMQDDVPATLKEIAGRRSEAARELYEIKELTSRVSQLEIRDMLDQLKITAASPGTVDVLLASNMISVGVDVPRLGLMVVNGQPKGIAEYIQATSRVGRGDGPGLIVSVYNNAKARDRSHYETFRTWHQTLYREVESTSVTPFAPRARDRALHSVLVALVRHLTDDMTDNPVLTQRGRAALEEFKKLIAERAASVDPSETAGVVDQLELLSGLWDARTGLVKYWNDRRPATSLLISAETAAAARASGRTIGEAWPTMNNMRNVEPATSFDLSEGLENA